MYALYLENLATRDDTFQHWFKTKADAEVWTRQRRDIHLDNGYCYRLDSECEHFYLDTTTGRFYVA